MQNRNWVFITASSLVIASALVVSPASADINGFGDFSNFTINQSDGATPPAIFPGQDMIQLTGQAGGEIRSIWCNTAQDITEFNASFTYRAVGDNGPIGGCLVFQNSPAGIHALGQNFNSTGFGYDGITKSAAISLQLPGSPTFTGFYSGGNVGGGAFATSPVNLLSGDPINVNVSYNGSILHVNIMDTITAASFDKFYAGIDIPTLVGGSTALVGFTADTGNPSFSIHPDQYFSNLQFSNVPAPGALSLFSLGGLGFLRRRRSM